MLALTRKKGETIIIGNNIEVVVLGIHGEQVKLGFIAPKEVPVHRKEVYEQIQDENMKAATASHAGPDTLKNLINLVNKK